MAARLNLYKKDWKIKSHV